MDRTENGKKEAKPGRMEVLRDLPGDIMKSLNKEEVNAFLFKDIWPDSLKEKLKDYLVEGE